MSFLGTQHGNAGSATPKQPFIRDETKPLQAYDWLVDEKLTAARVTGARVEMSVWPLARHWKHEPMGT